MEDKTSAQEHLWKLRLKAQDRYVELVPEVLRAQYRLANAHLIKPMNPRAIGEAYGELVSVRSRVNALAVEVLKEQEAILQASGSPGVKMAPPIPEMIGTPGSVGGVTYAPFVHVPYSGWVGLGSGWVTSEVGGSVISSISTNYITGEMVLGYADGTSQSLGSDFKDVGLEYLLAVPTSK